MCIEGTRDVHPVTKEKTMTYTISRVYYFPDRRASSRGANDLHGNKLTPWRATKNAFDLSAYFREVLDFCQAGRSISPEITAIIQRRAT